MLEGFEGVFFFDLEVSSSCDLSLPFPIGSFGLFPDVYELLAL